MSTEINPQADDPSFPGDDGRPETARCREVSLALRETQETLRQVIAERQQTEAALRASEEQYQSIFKSTTDGLFVHDLEGNLVDFNPAASRMHGYTDDDFRQLQPDQFIHPDSLPIFRAYLRTIREGRQFRGSAVDICKDGTNFPVEVFGTRFTYRGQPHALAVVRDITEQVQAYQLLERRVEERTRELSALLDVSRNVASTLELRPLLELILNQLKTVVDYSGATIVTLQDDIFRVVEYVGPIQREQALQTPLHLMAGYRKTASQRAPVIIADLWDDSADSREIRAAWEESLAQYFRHAHSWLGAPLLAKDCLIGVLAMEHIRPDYFTLQDAHLVSAFADQAAVAIENARLYEQAQALAALEERQKLARELHDSVSQALYGIALGARTARTLLDRDPAKAVEPLDYCLSLADAGLMEMRALIFELRPESLEAEGLVTALTKQADSLHARLGIQVHTQFCEEPAIPLAAKEALYRIAQEAMQNIIKHAHASEVTILLERDGECIRLLIRDNGRGFDPKKKHPGHLGLKSMQERAQKIGGLFDVESQPGGGAAIQVTLEKR